MREEKVRVGMPGKVAKNSQKNKLFRSAFVGVLVIGVIALLFYGGRIAAMGSTSGDGEGQGPKPGETHEEMLARFQQQAQTVSANELGQVPILVYHRIGTEEGRWTRTPANFRKDLQDLYDHGYVLVPLTDYLEGKMDVPAGKSPAIITFDDSSAGQFRLLPAANDTGDAQEQKEQQEQDAGETANGLPAVNVENMQLDPDCAVGILLQFEKDHPGFGHCATFYVNALPFGGEQGQTQYWEQKLQMLAEWGFEIGNHTYGHAYLSDLSPDEMQKQIGMMQQAIQKAVPDYTPTSLAIVEDGLPEDKSLVLDGEYDGTKYHHLGIVLWAWSAAKSPFDKDFDATAIQRIQVFNDKGGSTLTMWLDRISAKRYISDGEITSIAFPQVWQDSLGDVGEREVIAYPDPVQGPGEDRSPAKEDQAANVKAVHVTFSYASSQERWNGIVQLVQDAGFNAIELDVKDESGRMGYTSSVQLAQDIGACSDMLPIRDMLSGLRDRGLYSVARIVVFRDPVLAKQRPEYMVKTASGVPVSGGEWVNPYLKDVWKYDVDLAEEAYAVGFDEVQFDYIRFPEGQFAGSSEYGAAGTTNKVDTICAFLEYARQRLGWGRRLSAAVFGFMGYAKDDQGIGQRPERMAPYLDYMSPMVYPSHYSPWNYGFENPNAHPYEIVDGSLKDFEELIESSGCRLRPWLQAFTMGSPPYGREQIQAQIKATRDNGINTWLLWNAGVNFKADQIREGT